MLQALTPYDRWPVTVFDALHSYSGSFISPSDYNEITQFTDNVNCM